MNGRFSLPPVIELLLSERVQNLESPESLQKLLSSGFYRELRDQAEGETESYFQEAVKDGSLAIVPTGSIDPFSPRAKCSEISCRIQTARALAVTLGLYSDCVITPDVISALILQHD